MKKNSASINVKYLQTLVECLSMLGKVAAAGAIIWYILDLIYCVDSFTCLSNWKKNLL